MISAVLTIDDVASNNTPAIADYLESRGIQAIMFACGKKLEQLQENGVYALKHGMILGNHSDPILTFHRFPMKRDASGKMLGTIE